MFLKRSHHQGRSWFRSAVYSACLLLAGQAFGQAASSSSPNSHVIPLTEQRAQPTEAPAQFLQQFNASLEALAEKASPAVVEVEVTSFGPVLDLAGNRTAVVGRQSALGSGVIVDPTGYIMTNAHVVADARSIQVTTTVRSQKDDGRVEKAVYPAQLVGVHRDTDLALLKIDGKNLPYLPLDPRHPIRVGELVLALGNPEGLGNSISMGVVSAVDRQADPSLPMVYIQTDAPINPGNSGGPLIDAEGYLLGINTFILSSSGGSQGLGFAIPVRVVSFVYDRLRKYGHVDRSEIGAASEAITPLLAQGLHLPVSSGVMIVDVKPGGPAEAAGVKINDVVWAIDGRRIRTLPQLAASLYLHPTDQAMKLELLRGAQKLTLDVPVLAQKHDVDRLLDLVDPKANRVRKLGVLALDVNDQTLKMLPELRIPSGVVVVANTSYGRAAEIGLLPGDVIHAINTKPVTSLEDLQREIASLETGAAVVLQVERGGGMDYASFEIE